jgi:hypothetical protein
LVKFR